MLSAASTHLEIRHKASERNKRRILTEILLRGPLPRNLIAERIGITQASVSRITRDLINAGLVEETGHYPDDSKPGRKRIGVQVRADGGFVAGITINAFQQDILIANIGNGTVAEKRLHFNNLEQADDVLETCARQLNQLIDQSGINRNRLFGCGVTITGAIDPLRGKLRHAPALGWTDVSVRSILERALQLPIVIENIPNAKNLAARFFGPAKNINNAVLFNCSLAIGTSLVIDGNLLRGAKSDVGLIENLLVPDAQSTNKLKPLDLMAGGFGIIGEPVQSDTEGCRMARRLTEVIEMDSDWCVGATRSLEQAGRALAYAIMVANSFLHPQMILLSGPLINSRVYRNSVQDEVLQLVSLECARNKVEFFRISSQDATQSLAIHHFLIEREFLRDPFYSGMSTAA